MATKISLCIVSLKIIFSWLSGEDLKIFTTRRDEEVKKAVAKYKITDYYEQVKKIVAD